ncbi:Mtc1 protein [Hanseniaspora uvarum]|nr:Mtc1 protein [Hanseniaspora uvarum]
MSDKEKDVMDFLDNLPQKSTKKSSSKVSLNKKKPALSSKKDNANVLDFLDELEEHKNTAKSEEPDSSKIEKESVEYIETPTATKSDNSAASKETEPSEEAAEEESVHEEEVSAPFSGFTSWFSNATTGKLGDVDSLINQTKSTLQKNLGAMSKPELNDLQKGFKDLLSQTMNKIEEHVPDFIDDNEDDEEDLMIFLQHDIPNWKFDKLCRSTFRNILSDQVQDGVEVHIKEILGELSESQNFFEGKVNDAEKLCLANLEDTVNRYKASTEGDVQSKQSKIFISVVGVTVPLQEGTDAKEAESVVDSTKEGNFSLVFVLRDITNNVEIIQRSQSIPDKWIQWVLNYKKFQEKEIDPSKWVSEWIEQLIILNFQILAQNYVVKRINF